MIATAMNTLFSNDHFRLSCSIFRLSWFQLKVELGLTADKRYSYFSGGFPRPEFLCIIGVEIIHASFPRELSKKLA